MNKITLITLLLTATLATAQTKMTGMSNLSHQSLSDTRTTTQAPAQVQSPARTTRTAPTTPAQPTKGTLPADPWANTSPAADKTQQRTIRPGGQQNTLNNNLPQFVGENTTWNTAMGQKEIAPDVNITNMLLMTQHLRNMGYKVPDGLDNLINTAPTKLRNEIARAMNEVQNSNHPASLVEKDLSKTFERLTGFDLENLIMNSLRVIDNRR